MILKLLAIKKITIASTGNLDISSDSDINIDTPNGTIHMNKSG